MTTQITTISDDAKTAIRLLQELKVAKEVVAEKEFELSFYKNTIKQLASITHTDRQGNTKLISELENEHLVNIVVLLADRGIDRVPEKYLAEVRARWFISQVVEKLKSKGKANNDNDDDYEWDWWDLDDCH